jgi:hypothetical protein
MGKGKGRSKSGGTRNDNRKCGKAWKKKPRKQRKTGRTIGGYSPAKLKIREYKRQNYIESDREVLSDE